MLAPSPALVRNPRTNERTSHEYVRTLGCAGCCWHLFSATASSDFRCGSARRNSPTARRPPADAPRHRPGSGIRVTARSAPARRAPQCVGCLSVGVALVFYLHVFFTRGVEPGVIYPLLTPIKIKRLAQKIKRYDKNALAATCPTSYINQNYQTLITRTVSLSALSRARCTDCTPTPYGLTYTEPTCYLAATTCTRVRVIYATR